ncbi:hypothetical protein IEQ34_015921 [Dendrobium chrysotoxum]|uniref:Uncharacterized protein n=1 Tax=Dendrobium chrysotoxum TaxID=161865 RepID=A0AAV7GJI6_DENCH|nr:hypothetical protein IEQ34_015921 [Dendrobium chrysotoxum]
MSSGTLSASGGSEKSLRFSACFRRKRKESEVLCLLQEEAKRVSIHPLLLLVQSSNKKEKTMVLFHLFNKLSNEHNGPIFLMERITYNKLFVKFPNEQF